MSVVTLLAFVIRLKSKSSGNARNQQVGYIHFAKISTMRALISLVLCVGLALFLSCAYMRQPHGSPCVGARTLGVFPYAHRCQTLLTLELRALRHRVVLRRINANPSKLASSTPPSRTWKRPGREQVIAHEIAFVSSHLFHKITQHPGLSGRSMRRSAIRVAASNTSSTPSPVSDEHSRYFRAPISFAISVPSASAVNRIDFFRISSLAAGSSRRSFLRPTRRIGTPGHRSCASSIHCEIVSKRSLCLHEDHKPCV